MQVLGLAEEEGLLPPLKMDPFKWPAVPILCMITWGARRQEGSPTETMVKCLGRIQQNWQLATSEWVYQLVDWKRSGCLRQNNIFTRQEC